MDNQMQIFIAMALYMAAVIGIGLFYARRANQSSEDYFLGGRKLGPWVTAMSAEASDMSGWLLMGLPGVAYWSGISDAFWTAVGLAVGTYLNWLLLARRLRSYSVVANNAITIPEFFSARYREKYHVLELISATFILVFFTVYAGSCFVTCGKLFGSLFNMPYIPMMLIGALFVIIYTLLGGFLAESTSDLMQSIVMIFALIVVLITGLFAAGGIGEVLENVKSIPGFFDLFGIAAPALENGVQSVANGAPVFGEAGSYGLLAVLSAFSWGLGYFGMPQVLLRFMAIEKPQELKKSRRIATVWAVISLFAAIVIGFTGRVLFPTALGTSAEAENVFIIMSTSLLPSFIAGIVMAGILAATMSSSDSYLLIAASAFAKNIYPKVLNKNATDKQVMWVSRVILILISLIGVVIALDENSVIFTIVSFAWAGFGATFGPVMIASLFWKRTTWGGALAGMLTGGITVFVWKLVIKPFGGVFGIYELLPAFILSAIAIVIVSLLSQQPSDEIQKDFETAKQNA